MARLSALVPTIVSTTSLVQSLLLPRSWTTLELPAPAPASFQVRGGSMFGLDLQSACERISSMVGSGSRLMNTPFFFSCSFRSLKSASSTLGLLGGDLGEPPVGVFLQVEE